MENSFADSGSAGEFSCFVCNIHKGSVCKTAKFDKKPTGLAVDNNEYMMYIMRSLMNIIHYSKDEYKHGSLFDPGKRTK